MKIQYKIIALSLISGTIVWIIDAVLDFLFSSSKLSFYHILILDVPRHHLYIRLVGIISFLILGLFIGRLVTLRKRAEDALIHAHLELNQIFNAVVPLCVVGKNYKMLRVNETFCAMFGLKKEDIVGKKCHELWNGPFCNSSNCPMRQIVQGAEISEYEMDKSLKNGRMVSIIITAIPYRGLEGELIGIVENFTDITERKNAEGELQKYRFHLEEVVKERTSQLILTNEQLHLEIAERKQAEEAVRLAYTELDQIFEAAADGMCVIDKDFKVTTVNETFCDLFGTKKEEIVGKSCYETVYNSLCRNMIACPIILITNGEEHFEHDVEIERNDGARVSCILTAIPFRRPDGQIIGIVESFKNISERKAAEEMLKESEEKYSTLVEQASDSVIVVQDGIFKFVNKAMSKMTGYPGQELVDKSLFEIMLPDTSHLDIQKEKALLSEQTMPSVYQGRIKCRDGTIKTMEVSVSTIKYNGKAARMGIIRDITERKRIEEEMQKVQRLESLGILAGGIAHDFNNLLAAMVGNLSMLELYLKSGHGHDVYEVLESAKIASQQAKRLTQQLLTFARGGAPVKKLASISKLLKDNISFALSGSNVKCELSLPDDLWWVEIDEGQISQAINNLIINADQAMPNGGKIMILAQNVVVNLADGLPIKEGKYIKISIKDYGIGIPEEYLPKIFDPYFSTKSKGSGLGLAITYSVIKRHEGYVRVESQVGAGTGFYIYLPASDKEIFMVKDMIEEKISYGRGKVLFMDDQPNIRDMIGQMLTHIGYEVKVAEDGVRAIELYREAKNSGQVFDAVILDLTVPGGMGGEEAIQKLQEIDPKVKAIVSSGYSNDPIMANYKDYGFKGVVAKPYEIQELSKVLQKTILDA